VVKLKKKQSAMKKWLLLTGFALCFQAQAQQKYSLQQCISTALENNLQIKQGQLQIQVNQNNLDQSRYQRYPNLNFNGSQGIQSGRNIDPFTNQFVEKSVNFSQFGLNTGVTLFNGFQQKNTIKQNELNAIASQKDFESSKNTLSVNVANAYLTVLNNEEQLDNTRRQVAASLLQLERTTKLVKAGSLAQTTQYDIQAQVANDELAVVNAQNSVEIAKLTLKQLMNLPANEQVDIVRIQLQDPSLNPYDATIEQVYNAALKYLPDMEAAQLRIESAKTGVEIVKGTKMPTISLNGGLSSSYSSAAPSERFVGDGGNMTTIDVPSQTRYVQYAGIQVPVIERITVPSGSLQSFGYFSQLNFNRNTNVSIGLRMPIFNGYQVKYRTANAQIQQKNVEFQSQIIRNQIRQNVEQAYYTMLNAAKRFQATSNQVQSLELAFKAAESRFNAGAINSLDYNIAKTNLDRARGNLIQSKYDYVFRTKILDFYQNKPLTVE
jgi:outer membrane protein